MGVVSTEEMSFTRKVITQIVCMAVVSFGVMSSWAVDWSGKKISISGDSYSAFGTNQQYPGKTDVKNQSQMWWSQVISYFGGELEVNGSWSGSAISYDYSVCPSFPTLARDGGLGDPDIIMIMGGLNDFWVLGVNEATFRTKVNAFFNLLDAGYPQAEKIVIINKIHSNMDAKWGLAPMYRNVLRELSGDRGYKVVDLEGHIGVGDGDFDTPEYPHPTKQGQAKIAQRVISALENAPLDYLRQLDYLEMDGAGYMVTDYVPNLRTTEITVRMRIFDGGINETNVLFYASGYTAGNEEASNVYSLVWSSGGIRYLNSTDGGLTSVGPKLSVTPDQDGSVVDVVVAGNTMRIGEYSLASYSVAPNVQASGNLVIGAMREGGAPGSGFVGMGPKKIYNIKIKENGLVVRDYYPVLNLEGKATLCDMETGMCLGVYGGGTFRALDFDGAYVNYNQYRAYEDFYEAYAAANVGETVTIKENPAEMLSITGRLNVAIDTSGFSNVEVLAPDIWHRVFRDGTVYCVGRNDDLMPKFAYEKLSDLFVPVDGKLRLHIVNVAEGFVYAVYVRESLTAGEWRKIGEGLERADFEVDAPVGANSFFIKATIKEGN